MARRSCSMKGAAREVLVHAVTHGGVGWFGRLEVNVR